MDSDKEARMLTIKVLGPGCANCKKLKEVVNQVVEELHVEAKVLNVMNYNDFLAYDLMATPGLVINEKLLSHGRVPRPSEVSGWIQEALKVK